MLWATVMHVSGTASEVVQMKQFIQGKISLRKNVGCYWEFFQLAFVKRIERGRHVANLVNDEFVPFFDEATIEKKRMGND